MCQPSAPLSFAFGAFTPAAPLLVCIMRARLWARTSGTHTLTHARLLQGILISVARPWGEERTSTIKVLLDCGEGCLARMMLLAQHYHRQANGTRGGRGGGGGGGGGGESGAERAGRTGWQACGGGAGSAGGADIRGRADKRDQLGGTGEDCRLKNMAVAEARGGGRWGRDVGRKGARRKGGIGCCWS